VGAGQEPSVRAQFGTARLLKDPRARVCDRGEVARKDLGMGRSAGPGAIYSVGVGGRCLNGFRRHGLGERHRPANKQHLVFLDAAVGLTFVAAAATSGGPLTERGWMVAVGMAWPLGVLPAARSLHSALLLVALAAFPSGRIRRPWQFVVAILAVLLGLQLFDQLATAASFAFCAVGSALAWRKRRVSTPYAAISATAIFGVLSTAWFLARYRPDQFRPSEALLVYESVLVLIAVGYAIAARADARRREALEDRLVADAGPTGIRGLEVVLRDVLHDPKLRILPAGARPDVAGTRILSVADGSAPVAEVVHNASSLDDPAIGAAVSAAIRLTLIQEHRQAELAQRVADLESARMRIVASTDRQRERAAMKLRNDLGMLDRAGADLAALRGTAKSEVGAVLDIAGEEIGAATREIEDLVAGVPPTELGGGGLGKALKQLTARSPVPASLTIGAETKAGVNEETALYYACMEALTNAVRHAHASSVQISLTRIGTELVVTVRDNGTGGADPTGSGLQGLSDRLATFSGRLQVQSAPGAGTIVTATIPLTRFSATA
jgi:signal transduction histidine kinase